MSGDKIVSWPTLARRLQRERRRGRKIVFTNGCFDLLHIGHLKVFESAKKQGDVLVLGLNSDASIRRLKGPKRPIVPFRDRAELLSGLEVIDLITAFPQDTPAELIDLVRPDVLVKGGDWKADEIVGRDKAKRVVRIPLVKGRSTTDLIRRIVDRYGR